MTKSDKRSTRREFFDGILLKVRAQLKNELVGGDSPAVLGRLDEVAETCFRKALQQTSDYTPKKEFRRIAWAELLSEVAPEVDAAKDEIEAERRQQLQHEVERIQACRDEIGEFRRQVQTGVFGEGLPLRFLSSYDRRRGIRVSWRGADIIVTRQTPTTNFTGSSTVVVTRYAMRLTQLLYCLRDTAREVLDYRSKYEFYGAVADAVNAQLEEQPDTSETQVLLTAVEAADDVLRDWQRQLCTLSRS